jgi:paraquat-inducible protein B
MRDLILTLIIWIICFTAITAGVSLSYSWYKNRGADIYINFDNVEGIMPNNSKIMYLGVQIGSVKKIHLNSETGLPVVTARISKQFEKFLGPKSSFWIVRPELALAGVRNLGTIASGNYIGVNPVPGDFTRKFTALEDAPTDTSSSNGMHLLLKAESAKGIEIGSAILYHGLQIGQVDKLSLSLDKRSVIVQVYIDNDYTSVIRKNSYFGNVSGFHASIHLLTGSEIHMNSFRTLINGAIEVVTPSFNEHTVTENYTFNLLNEEEFANLQES